MANEEEVIIDPINEEEVEETVEETEETTEPKEEKEEKSTESPEAKKARLERQLNQLGKKYPDLFKEKESKKSSKKSDELDYAQKAFLMTNDIKGSKEFDFVKDELKKSGEELESLLENEYFKSKLEKFRALNKTSEAIPKGKGNSGVQTDSVEYWMGKPIEEVPQEMRVKVVNARLKKEEGKGMFYNQK